MRGPHSAAARPERQPELWAAGPANGVPSGVARARRAVRTLWFGPESQTTTNTAEAREAAPAVLAA